MFADFATFHLIYLVTKQIDIIGMVTGKDHGLALMLKRKKQSSYFLDTIFIKAIERFIKDQNIGVRP